MSRACTRRGRGRFCSVGCGSRWRWAGRPGGPRVAAAGAVPASPGRPGPTEAGSATILVLALSVVLMLVGATGTALAEAAVARHRAASAADLAALAAADRATSPGAACPAAARAARAVGARLQRCELDGLLADVEVAVRPAGWLGRLGEASARARAGPGDRPGAPPDL